jgi:protein O-GlcNAc transferase
MNYYKDHYVLQAAISKQREYTAAKQIALSEIYEQLNDGERALSLLRRFVEKYKSDNSIYLSVNDISSRLQALDVLAESTQKAIAFEPLNAQAHYDFGSLLFDPKCRKRGKTHDILLRYLRSADEGHSCGAILSSDEDLDSALDIAEKYFRSKTKSSNDYVRLGNFLTFARRFDEAAMAFRRATKLQYDCSIAYRNLSLVYTVLGCLRESHFAMGQANFFERKYALAIERYIQAISFGEESSETYERLAQSYLHEGQFSRAAAICAEAVSKKKTVMLYTMWIDALQSINQIERALQVAEWACSAFPQEQYFQFPARLILPVVYKSEEDISCHRARFCRTLHAWSAADYVSGSAISNIKGTNFYLPYQGQCDLDIQKEYGRLINRIVATTAPKFGDRVPHNRGPGKTRVRVGYISAFCSWHTVGKLFFGWVQGHDSELFDVYVYHLGRRMDFLSRAFKASSRCFVHCADRDLAGICESILTDELDILVHLEFGMNPLISKIAALRLAPIQCLAWGHPVTSGLPTMDYFLSSELMEPPDADHHYSEALVRLPNIGVCVPRPLNSVSNKTRAYYGLSDNRTIYVFPHSLFKQLPQYDWIFPAIAKQNPESEFVFIERDTHSVEAAQAFKARVAGAFRQRDLDANEYVRFVPHQGLQDFLRLLSLSDVYLDCIGWSGGMTTLEALGCMLPIVTIPGQFMRGRHAYGCLQRIDIRETVAQNAEEYVNVAARLGLDEAWRRTILSKQATNLHRLYDDRECLIELEKFYKTIAQRER